MIGLSMLLLPYPLSYIPAPVLDGLFLYVAITAVFGNQLFDRILLFFTEQVQIVSSMSTRVFKNRSFVKEIDLATLLFNIQNSCPLATETTGEDWSRKGRFK